MNALNYRNRGDLKISGEIKINGQLIKNIDEISSISGYVQQDDLFVGCLTVKENLLFQAMLRMEKKYSEKERIERVEQVMIDVKKKRNTKHLCLK